MSKCSQDICNGSVLGTDIDPVVADVVIPGCWHSAKRFGAQRDLCWILDSQFFNTMLCKLFDDSDSVFVAKVHCRVCDLTNNLHEGFDRWSLSVLECGYMMTSELYEHYFPRRKKYLDYANVAIIPDMSTISSRATVRTDGFYRASSDTQSVDWDVPIIPANMDSIVGVQLVKNTITAGGVASLHRFSTIDYLVKDLSLLGNVNKARLFGSTGLLTKDIEQRRATILYQHGITNFMIDVAHGHSVDMMQSIKWLRQRFGRKVNIAAGNVGTSKAVNMLASAGANFVKVGIAGGKVCRTRNVTGVYTPMFSTILECANNQSVKDGSVVIIADGGIREYGDVAKAIGAGAGLVMAGYLFAGCTDANMPSIYRGMASNEVAYNAYELGLREDKPTAAAEGIQITVADANKKSSDVVVELQAALRSAYSYVGARNTKEFQELVRFVEIDSTQR